MGQQCAIIVVVGDLSTGERSCAHFVTVAQCYIRITALRSRFCQNHPMPISICLWFNNQAEEAAEFYCSTIRNSRILAKVPASPGTPGVASGDILLVKFLLDGTEFTALNGGPKFAHTEAFSIEVACESQQEVDRYWEQLVVNGGQHSQCGWLKDRFGVSWQITPTDMGQYLGGTDAEGRQRAMAAMLTMQKIDLDGLRRAYEGEC